MRPGESGHESRALQTLARRRGRQTLIRIVGLGSSRNAAMNNKYASPCRVGGEKSVLLDGRTNDDDAMNTASPAEEAIYNIASFALLLAVSAGVAAAQAIKNKSLFTAAEEARLKAMDSQQRETELRRIAETERDHGQGLLYAANMNLAKRDWDAAYVSRPVELLELYRPQPGQPDLRNF